MINNLVKNYRDPLLMQKSPMRSPTYAVLAYVLMIFGVVVSLDQYHLHNFYLTLFFFKSQNLPNAGTLCRYLYFQAHFSNKSKDVSFFCSGSKAQCASFGSRPSYNK